MEALTNDKNYEYIISKNSDFMERFCNYSFFQLQINNSTSSHVDDDFCRKGSLHLQCQPHRQDSPSLL